MATNPKLGSGEHGGRNVMVVKQGSLAVPEAEVDGVVTLVVAQTDGAGNLPRVTDNGDGTFTPQVATSTAAPTAANILNGAASPTASQAATTFMTVPANRTWSGTVSISCSASVAAASAVAGHAQGIVSAAGVGGTPTGVIAQCDAWAAANAATGTVGSSGANQIQVPVTIVAGANPVNLQLATTIAGTNGTVNAVAFGQLF